MPYDRYGRWVSPKVPWSEQGELTPEDEALMAAYDAQPAAVPAGAPGAVPPSQLEVLAGQRAKAIGTQAALSAGLGAGQLALSFIPTAYDRYNRERLGSLQDLQAQGQLGLTSGQREQMEQEAFAPVAAQAHASRLRQEGLQASMGNAASAADVTRAQREETRAVNQAAQQAGLAISRANLDEANAQLQEIEERVAYKGGRATGRLEQGSKAIGALAPLAGRVAAAQRIKGVDWEKLSPEDRQLAMALASENPEKTYAMQALIAGMGTR